jgi:DedD protein
MPPPSSENDLKRRARRRLIGAVALTLLAVILLPLLLEDEPRPGSPLAVRMAVLPPTSVPAVSTEAAVPAVAPPVQPLPSTAQMDTPRAVAEPAPEPVKPVPPKPEAKPRPPPEVPKPQMKPVAPSVATVKPAAGEGYAVQVAALQDTAKVGELEKRVRATGLPVYTDRLGPLTRVRVGPFPTREAAQEAVRKLHSAGIKDAVLTP